MDKIENKNKKNRPGRPNGFKITKNRYILSQLHDESGKYIEVGRYPTYKEISEVLDMPIVEIKKYKWSGKKFMIEKIC